MKASPRCPAVTYQPHACEQVEGNVTWPSVSSVTEMVDLGKAGGLVGLRESLSLDMHEQGHKAGS